MKTNEKLPAITSAAKLQDGLSFKDRLRATLEAKQVSQPAPTPTERPAERKEEKKPAAQKVAVTVAVAPQEKKEVPIPACSPYLAFFTTSEPLSFLQEDPKVLSECLVEGEVSFNEVLTIPSALQNMIVARYVFGRTPEPSKPSLNEIVDHHQAQPFTPSSPNPVPPPSLQDTKAMFSQPWLPALHSHGTMGQATSPVQGVPIDSGIPPVPVDQSNLLPGYRRDFLPPGRRAPSYPRKRNDFFGRMMPPVYPHMSGAFDYQAPFQMPYPQHGIPPPTSQMPPNFQPPPFMPNFQHPGRHSPAGAPDMYGVPPSNLGYGNRYPMNYGSH